MRYTQRIRYHMLATMLALPLVYMGSPIAATYAETAQIQEYNLDIPAQPLGKSLQQLNEITSLQYFFSDGQIATASGNALKGSHNIDSALGTLLQNTGYSFRFTDSGTVVVYKLDEKAPEITQKQSSVEKKSPVIEEIVVTATKRETSLQDTAMSITALGNEEIERRGLVGMGDYLNSVPGVSVLDEAAGRTVIIMRGVTADPEFEGLTGPTVGVYFGETPISGFGIFANSADIKLVDMERVEVLRGPQGTLYGSSSLGGTVRNIPALPNLQELEGNFKAGYSNTAGLGSGNSNLQAVINIPVIENQLAIRAVGYRYENSGLYKNVGANDPDIAAAVSTWGAAANARDNIGSDEYVGGRVSALWQPNDKFSINLMYLKQKIDQDGWPQTDLELGMGEFLQRRLQIRHPVDAPNFGEPEFNEEFSDDFELVNATIEYDLSWASIVSSTSWLSEDSVMNRDISSIFGFIPVSQPLDFGGDAFIQEVRLISQLDGPFQFTAGLYYEDTSQLGTPNDSWILFGGNPGVNPFGQILLLHNITDSDVEQHAVFGELSYALNEKVKLTFGGRIFSYDKKQTLIPADAVFTPGGVTSVSESSDNDINYKAGIDYTPNEDVLLYTSWSQGFRLGGSAGPETRPFCDENNDGVIDGSPGVSTGRRQVNSDFVDNYEIGGKFTMLDNRLQLNASLYQVDWDGIPLTVFFDNTCDARLNAGKARSLGAEIEGAYYLSDSLRLNFSTSYVNAELREDAPSLGGKSGDRLPGSPEYNFSVGFQYEFSIAGYSSFVRSDYVYVGGFYNNLQEAGIETGDYGKLNARIGFFVGSISIEAFANNITNEDALTWVSAEGYSNQRGYHLRPRTIGVDVSYRF